jgi:hypothetical protein
MITYTIVRSQQNDGYEPVKSTSSGNLDGAMALVSLPGNTTRRFQIVPVGPGQAGRVRSRAGAQKPYDYA